MTQLIIYSPTGTYEVEVAEGQNVRDALDTTEWRVRAACGGVGSCGACLVQLKSGEASPLTVSEYQRLSVEERAQGWRLSCQLRLNSDAQIYLKQLAKPSVWHSIPVADLMPPPIKFREIPEFGYGVAVDLGTTHLRVTLWNRRTGQRVASRKGLNPQESYGADVLNRLDAALRNFETAEKLSRLVRNSIIKAVRDMLAREIGEIQLMLLEIGQVMIVGNTAMLALLTGQGYADLLNPNFWQAQINCQPTNYAAWQAQWLLPHAQITVLPPVAGFVGSDLTADLVATKLCSRSTAAFLLDVGTNTEIALWTGKTLLITSVPGGSAFESVGIRNGMPAESGAILHVNQNETGLVLETINHEPARGFCGSGLVDAIAVLVATKVLKPSGRFAQSTGGEGFALIDGNPYSVIMGSDVDSFQRAKAAIASAMETLLELAKMSWYDVERLCVCGAFGRHLNIQNAQAIGLLPPISPDKVELNADASLAGCELALLSEESYALFDKITANAQTFNLSLMPDYENRYINHLLLKPIR
ncbi:MAG: ASKHA domain-containing protein [Methylococcales bacterium]|nr:ASKHA domain-containing protein [Methylococcales bacterium]